MSAAFPSRRLTWVLLVAGAIGALATVALFAHMFAGDLSGLAWSTPFLGAYAAGVIAFRIRPDSSPRGACSRSAPPRRSSSALRWRWRWRSTPPAAGWWLGPANVVVQLLGLAEGAAMVALLAVYPDGRLRPALRAAAGPRGRRAGGRGADPAAARPSDPAAGLGVRVGRRSPRVAARASRRSPARSTSARCRSSARPCACTWRLRSRSPRSPARSSSACATAACAPAQRLQIRWPMYGVLARLVAPLAHGCGRVPERCRSRRRHPRDRRARRAAGVGRRSACVKPDLFDVDRAMRRSLVYAPLWIAIAGAYVGIAAALGLAASGDGLQLAIARDDRRHGAVRAGPPPPRRARGAVGLRRVGQRRGALRRLGDDARAHARPRAADARRSPRPPARGSASRWMRIRVDGAAP